MAKLIKIIIPFFITISFIGCNDEISKVTQSLKDAEDQILYKDKTPPNEDTTDLLKDDSNISYSKEISDAIKRVNEIRAELYSGYEMSWSTKLADDALAYAKELAKNGKWEHDKKEYENGPYGENLYTSTKKPTFVDAINEWYSEKKFYTYGKVGDSSTCQSGQMCGHYTQLIWRDTSLFGCATSRYEVGEYKDWYLVVCKYKTPGNYYGETPY